MNNLAYSSQDPKVVAAKVAELVQEETKAEPVYEIQLGNATPTTLATVAAEGLRLLFTGKEATNLFTVHFTVSQPRAMTVSVPLDRQGVGCHGGGITYTTQLGKPVASEVVLGEPGFFSGAKFTGDADAAAKLNGNGTLLKHLKGFVRTKGNMGGVDVEIGRLFKLVPGAGGATLVTNSLAKPLKMGFAMSLEIAELAAIAALIESTL